MSSIDRGNTFLFCDDEKWSCVHYVLRSKALKFKPKVVLFGENATAVKDANNSNKPQKSPADSSPPVRAAGDRPCFRASLSMFEHNLYLQLRAKYDARRYKHVGTAAELQDLSILADLEKKVADERQRVNEYLYQMATSMRRNDYLSVNAEALKFVHEIFQNELQYSLQYPRFYSTDKIIPLLVPGTQIKDTKFTFMKVIFKQGQPPTLFAPTAGRHGGLLSKYDTLAKKFPPEELCDSNKHPSQKHISMDSIAYDLAAKYEADVVITLESLKTLVDNVFPKLERNWEAPVIVSEQKGPSGNICRRVYVEKALPSPLLTAREKYEMYYYYSIKAKFMFNYPARARRFSGYAPPTIPDEIKPVPKEMAAEVKKKMSNLKCFDDICDFSSNVCDVDTFGVSSVPADVCSTPRKSYFKENLVENKENESVVETEEPMSTSDEECDKMVDEDFLTNLKGMLFEMSGGMENADSKEENNTVDSPAKLGSPQSNDVLQCMTPDSDQDEKLVIDCSDTKDKTSSLPASAMIEKTTTSSDKMSVSLDSLNTNCQDSVMDSDDEILGCKRKKSPLKLASESEESDGVSLNGRQMKHLVKKASKKGKAQVPKDTNRNEGSTTEDKKKDETVYPLSPSANSTLDEILMSQHKMLNPKAKINGDTEKIVPHQFAVSQSDSMDDIAKDHAPLAQDKNVVYSLWRLGELKILLRSAIDHVVTPVGQGPQSTFIYPKLEYQSKFGFEVCTPSDAVKQWILLYTHPKSRVLKVRVDAPKMQLLMMEELVLQHLLETEKHNLNENQAINQLSIILNTLKNLPEGQYLLSHKKSDYTLTLRKAVDSAHRGAYDLHADIKNRMAAFESAEDQDDARQEIPWNPIDPSISLPEQKRTHRVPGCFFPIDFRRWNPQREGGNQNEGGKGKSPKGGAKVAKKEGWL